MSNNNSPTNILDKYGRYKIPKKRRSFKSICFPEKYILQPSQKFPAAYINPKTDNKSILLFHQIGSGKTCAAVNIGEKWKHKKEILFVCPASLKNNFRDELRTQCADNNYLKPSERKKLAKLKPSNEAYQKIIDRSDKRIDKFYNILSYHKFVSSIKNKELSLKNKILIIDEIQNMVSVSGTFYKVLSKAIQQSPRSLRIVLLSATPMFDKPYEIGLTANLLKLEKPFPPPSEFNDKFIKVSKTKKGICRYKTKNMKLFRSMLSGHISYFRGADPKAFPRVQIKYVKCRMQNFQYRSYITVLKKESEKLNLSKTQYYKIFQAGEIKNLPNNFFIGSRIISNVAFPNKGIGEDGYKSFKGKSLDLDNLKKYSIKFYKIMKNLKKLHKNKGKAYVYSNFKNYGGIKSFIKVLKHQGYKDYVDSGSGTKRYCIWSGKESIEYKNEIKNTFNNLNNNDGSKIQLMLISPSGKEGLSLKGIQQIHILGPYWNMSRIDQIMGRGNRYCSHKFMSPDMRQVKIYIYLAVHKNEIKTVDQYIYEMAIKKNKLIKEFELHMKKAAVDCKLFKNGNVYPELEEKDYKCD